MNPDPQPAAATPAQSPPESPRPEVPVDDPAAEIRRLAEELRRTHNRVLVARYLRLRRGAMWLPAV